MDEALAPRNLDLLRAFLPASAQRALGSTVGVPLISSALVAEHAAALTGPCLEVSWPGSAALSGALRAVRHAGALLGLRLPLALGATHRRARLDGVLGALAVVEQAGFDQPLVLIGEATPKGGDGSAEERLLEALLDVADVGLTSVSLRVGALAPDAREALPVVARALCELGVGLELDLEEGPGTGHLLARLEAAGAPLAAVRGAAFGDPRCGGVFVVDPARGVTPEGPLRISLDPFVLEGLARAVGPAGARGLHASARARGAGQTIALVLGRLAGFDAARRVRVEAFVYAEVAHACRALAACGVAGELRDALARELAADAAAPVE